MNKETLLSSLNPDQLNALNALLIEQRNELGAAHQVNLTEMSASLTHERAQFESTLKTKADSADEQVANAQRQVAFINDQLAKSASRISSLEGELSAIQSQLAETQLELESNKAEQAKIITAAQAIMQGDGPESEKLAAYERVLHLALLPAAQREVRDLEAQRAALDSVINEKKASLENPIGTPAETTSTGG